MWIGRWRAGASSHLSDSGYEQGTLGSGCSRQVVKGIYALRFDPRVDRDIELIVQPVEPRQRESVSFGVEGVAQTVGLGIDRHLERFQPLGTVDAGTEPQRVRPEGDRL